MDFLLRNVLIADRRDPVSIAVRDGRIVSVSCDPVAESFETVFSFPNCLVLPGLADVHVHFREPGFSYKETIRTGSRAAAHGGYTAVCTMPNLSPCPDDMAGLEAQLALIRRDAGVQILPYGCITVGQKGEKLADLEALAPYVAGFSDDGRGVQSEEMMQNAMLRAKKLGKLIVAHCEDNALLNGGYIHDGEYARAHGHRGICSQSEWLPIQRDLALVRKTGCAYHVCHVSTKESVALIRQAKAQGLDVTCETAPHYLLLDDRDLKEDGRFKMNPPIRSREDREALVEGLLDGTIDMVATDHAPHSAQEKGRGLKDSVMGVVGLENAFALLYTGLVRTGVLSLETLLDRMCRAPRARFGLESAAIAPGCPANLTVFDLNAADRVDPAQFLSMGKSTPFEGAFVQGRCLLTVRGGNILWQEGKTQP